MFCLISCNYLKQNFSVYNKILAILFLVARFTCAYIAAKFSPVIFSKFLCSNIFKMTMISSILLNLILCFLTKLLTLDILFPKAVRPVLVAKLVIIGISPLTSFILALRVVLVAK